MNILFYFRMKELKTIYHLKLQIETGLKAKSERADFLSHLLHILTSSIWRRTWDEFWIQGQTAIKSYLWNDRVLKKTTTQLSPKPVATQSMKYWWGSRGVHFFGVDFYCIFGRFEEMTPINKSEILGRLEPHGPHCLRRPWPKHIHESFFELIKSEIFKKSHQNAANFQKHILLRNLMQSAIAQNAANFLLKTGHP